MTEIVKSTWDLVREAIQSGRTDEALELLERGLNVATMQHNSLVSFVGMAINSLARFDEEELEKLYRDRYSSQAEAWISSTPGAKESVEKFAGLMENPYSKITIAEEPDRYVLSLNPCRTGGRLRRGLSVGSSKLAGRSIGTIKKAYPWSWNKSGVSYYCIHDCLFLEIIPIELRGYPIAVVQYADKPENPCVLFFYKKPELIPEEYFSRVGKTHMTAQQMTQRGNIGGSSQSKTNYPGQWARGLLPSPCNSILEYPDPAANATFLPKVATAFHMPTISLLIRGLDSNHGPK